MLLSFFLRIDLYLLISEVIAQVFNPTAELAITAGPPTSQANAEIETHPLTAEKNPTKCRRSRREVFLRKGILKICSKFTGWHPWWSVISIKLQSNFIEIALWHGCFSVNLLHIFRTTFPRNTSGWLLLKMFKVIQSPTHFMFYYALLLLKVNFMFHLFL